MPQLQLLHARTTPHGQISQIFLHAQFEVKCYKKHSGKNNNQTIILHFLCNANGCMATHPPCFLVVLTAVLTPTAMAASDLSWVRRTDERTMLSQAAFFSQLLLSARYTACLKLFFGN